jgi:hypothetical protein
MGLHVVAIVTVDQQLYAGVTVLADQINCLGHTADKASQWSASRQPFPLRSHGRVVPGKQPAVVVRLFNRGLVALCAIAVPPKHRELVSHHIGVAADIAGIGKASDRAQGELLAAAGNHDRRAGLLDRLRL